MSIESNCYCLGFRLVAKYPSEEQVVLVHANKFAQWNKKKKRPVSVGLQGSCLLRSGVGRNGGMRSHAYTYELNNGELSEDNMKYRCQ